MFRAVSPPIPLLPEPDESVAPKGEIGATAEVEILSELAGWAKVRLAGEGGDAGWTPRAALVRIDPLETRTYSLFGEPDESSAAQSLSGRILATMLSLPPWSKVRMALKGGGEASGWIKTVAAPAAGGSAAAGGQPPAQAAGADLVLGPNETYRAAILEAARRTRIDPAAIAALIDAEAARIGSGPNKGRWDKDSRASTSSAAGLTQFLDSTWLQQARVKGALLRERAMELGLVGADGKPTAEGRQALLDLRFDPLLAIVSAAEFGAANLTGLQSAGLLDAGATDDDRAKRMYLAHHEGLAGAQGFLNGTRAYTRHELARQVGGQAADDLIAAHGGADKAYRLWLTGYMDQKIAPSRFRRSGASQAAAASSALTAPAAAARHPEELVAYREIGAATRAALMADGAGAAPDVSRIGADKPLAIAVQAALSFHGYLDPPADGMFGEVSKWALREFAKANGLPPDDGLTSTLRLRLLDAQAGLPAPQPTGTWIDKVIAYVQASGYFICRHPSCVNILYIEGMSPDGTLNADLPNQFNDTRLVFWLDKAGRPAFEAWEATSEPGDHYTFNPLNPAGAARIAFRQFKSWAVGSHPRNPPNHSALVQTKHLTVHRDFNRDGKRTGDRLDRGDAFGVNQHWGYDLPLNDIRNGSAGCLVGRTRDGHKEFMSLVRSDARYKASNAYTFVAAILPGDRLGLEA
jgi:peptidoglycan hydrolase-like protein with peptidoglycan-binding domain